MLFFQKWTHKCLKISIGGTDSQIFFNLWNLFVCLLFTFVGLLIYYLVFVDGVDV